MSLAAFDRATLDHVARLARLSLTAEEREVFAAQLRTLLEYFAQLETLDLSGVEPTAQVFATGNVFREDVVRPSLPREEVLAAAPDRENGYFKVPPVLEPPA